ncbi:MAG: hypothetical protein EHM34_00300 [Nitrosopumilales archaeon]|nr:MAG: hypothetical protein EHM34_00300 [Nitrosopumilales archaeon]
METKNCVRCGKPAKFWSGHVDYFTALKIVGRPGKKFVSKIERKSVLAGWCSKRCYNDVGFCGMFNPWMGEVKGKIPSMCKCADHRDNMIHINWCRFRCCLGAILFAEGIVLGIVGGGLFSLAFTAMGLYVILSRRWK